MKIRKIKRRTFLKIGAAAVGGGVLSSPFGPGSHLFGSPLPAEKMDREVDSCCQFCNPENYWTGGAMCPKGKSMVELTYSPDRILYPMLREGNDWRRISYQQALGMVAERILKVKADYPEDYAHRVALFMPLWESVESELAALMAMNLAGFPDTPSPGDGCIASAATVLNICLGSPNSPTTLDEALNAQTLVLWGTNIAEMYPPFMRWIAAARAKGVKIIYLDPRRTPTSNFCDVQYMPRPGTDGALALGVARIMIKEGLYDATYVQEQVNGFDELVEAVELYNPERVEEITWIPAQKVVELGRSLGKSRKTIIWLAGSLNRYTNGMQTIRNIIALQAITNNLSGSGKGLMSVQGGKPAGEYEFMEHYHAEDLPPKLNTRKVLYNMKKGRLDVLLLNGSYRRYPNATETRKRISKVGFVVYRGFFMDEEAELSHLIIPATMVYESEGSQYGAQRQVVWRNRVIDRPGETVEDWRFYLDLGKKLNPDTYPDVNSAEDIYELFRKTVPSWGGLTLERLKASPTGVTWPSYSANEPESRGNMFKDGKVLTDDGKAVLKFKPLGKIRWYEPKGSPKEKKNKNAKDFPLFFMQGKVVQHWQHTYTNWSKLMGQLSHGNFVQVHPETASKYDLKDGDLAFIETKVGRLKAVVKISEFILPGVVFTPSHPGPANPVSGNQGQSVNTIVPPYWDKVSAQFNGFGCRLVKA
jgi:formate dehydrogenase major subunit